MTMKTARAFLLLGAFQAALCLAPASATAQEKLDKNAQFCEDFDQNVIIMGKLSRSAPAMNHFSVGLPATLLAGLILLAIAAPAMGEGIIAAMQRGLGMARVLAGG